MSETVPVRVGPLRAALVRALNAHPYWHASAGNVNLDVRYDAGLDSWFFTQTAKSLNGIVQREVSVRACSFEGAALELMLVVERLWITGEVSQQSPE